MKNWKDFFRQKVIAPMTRSRKDSRYIARAGMIGLGSSFLPFPVQMPIVFAIWVGMKKLHWRFSLMLGLALTFVSNAFTNLPIFYGEYVLGGWMRGRFELFSYELIKSRGLGFLLKECWLNIAVGSVPLVLFFGLVGYVGGYCVSRHYAKK